MPRTLPKRIIGPVPSLRYPGQTERGSVCCHVRRPTLWNAVEKAERGKKAQLAYSFDIALQNEFSLEENIALARQFVSEQLVGRGMIADFALHQPDKEDGGIPNPHFYVLCPIRPIEPDGKWGCKQRRRYRLDKDVNRWIRKANNILRDLRKKIAGLTDWIKAIKGEWSQPQAPTLAALLADYYAGWNAVAWSRNARIGNLKDFAEAVNFLAEKFSLTTSTTRRKRRSTPPNGALYITANQPATV